MKNPIKFIAFCFAIFLTACTSVEVKPVSDASLLRNVCIEKNPRVTVPGFLEALQDGFANHDIKTKVISAGKYDSCDAILTYTALRSWDLKPYLSHAELRLNTPDGRRLGHAIYHLDGGGGFDLSKFSGVREKMFPVIDQLLGGKPATQQQQH
ncbi:MAG: hypothetical protein D6717_06750 [Gammaproteobacteria bacterium]|nr:MAG: hypothetical protein D6717_06750 [Gammaproteobacteria bacterium]